VTQTRTIHNDAQFAPDQTEKGKTMSKWTSVDERMYDNGVQLLVKSDDETTRLTKRWSSAAFYPRPYVS
jgi:hypothetical protein